MIEPRDPCLASLPMMRWEVWLIFSPRMLVKVGLYEPGSARKEYQYWLEFRSI